MPSIVHISSGFTAGCRVSDWVVAVVGDWLERVCNSARARGRSAAINSIACHYGLCSLNHTRNPLVSHPNLVLTLSLERLRHHPPFLMANWESQSVIPGYYIYKHNFLLPTLHGCHTSPQVVQSI